MKIHVASAFVAALCGVGGAFAGGLPQPTPEAGLQPQVIDGEVIGAGVLCPQFRLLSGEAISLESLPPAAPALTPGARLRLSGQFARASRCQQGRAFVVQDITAAPG
ncbi:MAG: hypothetical protein Q8Q26_13875 [Pseudorhodobacter sp.]|nr:hypothetical protein [Pseudorhodobacter sp.]